MNNSHVVEVGEHNFDAEVAQADVPVIVDFGATWCAPCKALAPVVEAIAKEGEGRVKVVAVDIEEAPALAKRFAVSGMPTLIVFKKGEATARHVGVASKAKLIDLVGL